MMQRTHLRCLEDVILSTDVEPQVTLSFVSESHPFASCSIQVGGSTCEGGRGGRGEGGAVG